MYNATLNIQKIQYGATLNWSGSEHEANLQINETTFVATMAQNIRMLPDSTTNERLNTIETDMGDASFDFENYIDTLISF